IEDMGTVADTAMVAIVAAQATWDNFKAKTGGVILVKAARNIDDFRARMELLGNDGVGILTKLWVATSAEMDAVIALAGEWRDYNESIKKTKTVVEDIVWEYKEGIKSGIDWAEVNKTIFDQWVKENDIIKKQIELRNSLTEAIHANQQAALAGILEDSDKKQKKTRGTADFLGGFGDDITENIVDDPEVVALIANYGEITAATKKFTDEMNAMLSGMTAQAVGGFIQSLSEGLAGGDLSGVEDFFGLILKSFGNFVSQMGTMLIAYGIAMDAFKAAFTTPGAAIAAGVALVAIGGAMSGAAKRFNAGGGGFGGGGIGTGRIPSTTNAFGGTVNFQISGQNLAGVLERHDNRMDRFT
ncbi:hypothetical protein LCGC14_1871090, partial [marine sediment metagenome]